MKPASAVLSVSQAANLIGELLSALPTIRVQGEVAGYGEARGKFAFFSLKDPSGEALLGCFAMLTSLSTPLEDGMEVIATGTAGLYVKNGSLRITVRSIELVGAGTLERAYQLLLTKLEGEGLFAASRKRMLPVVPRRVAVISSQGAAGFGDFLKVAYSRLPGVEYRLYNVAVQGESAERQVVEALARANSEAWGEVVVLLRGGGSMEDLAAFNGEPIARAIVLSRIPVLTGIGHERDVTIADLVADVRAATPTDAAVRLLPELSEVLNRVRAAVSTISAAIHQQLEAPRSRVGLITAISAARLRSDLALHRQSLSGRVRAFQLSSPEGVLERGYTITTSNGHVLHSFTDVPGQTTIVTRFHDGTLTTHTRKV